jgi:hypothetical protein
MRKSFEPSDFCRAPPEHVRVVRTGEIALGGRTGSVAAIETSKEVRNMNMAAATHLCPTAGRAAARDDLPYVYARSEHLLERYSDKGVVESDHVRSTRHTCRDTIGQHRVIAKNPLEIRTTPRIDVPDSFIAAENRNEALPRFGHE